MKIKLLSIFSIVILISLLTFYRCTKNKIVPNLCFNKTILPIFISKCTTSGCHSGGNGRREDRFNFTTYEGIMESVTPYHPLLSSVYTECSGINPSMPPDNYAALTNDELYSIKYWIHTGAKNQNDCNVSCDTINVTFSGKILPLFNTWCTGCHNASNNGGGYDLSTYVGVKNAVLSNRLMGSINQLNGYSKMPKVGKLDVCDIIAVQKWIDAGFQNN
jgi:hypothetical protein